MKVLVTDGHQKHALAAIRALGREGVTVHVGSSARFVSSFLSRYCAGTLVYPDPARHETAFVNCLVEYAQCRRIDVLLPIGYDANRVVSKHKDVLLKYLHVAIADHERMEVASDKGKTMALAASVGVNVPKTYTGVDEVEEYPVVVKGRTGSGNVRYVNSRQELEGMDTSGSLVQEYIPGEGYGFFALFRAGEPRATFMHRRLRQWPVTGGASTLAESYYDEGLKSQGIRLLQALNWHGVAMVEMKRDARDGRFKLMEINPKYWGSLDLAIHAGVNFPYLAAVMAMEGDVPPSHDFRYLKLRWLFPQDVLHLISRPSCAGRFLKDFFDPHVETDLCPYDFAPDLYAIATTPAIVISRLLKGRLYRPHGRPGGQA
ncbi:carboxylate--amine ligase [Candidatus Nitrospira bockiana]